MAEPRPLHALLAEFAEPDDLIDAVERLRAAGYRHIEAFTPFPIEGLAEKIGFADRRVPFAFLIGGIVGALTGYSVQVFTNLDFPLDVGGRPLIASQAFMLITFELTVLFSVLVGIGAMLVLNRLPRLHHPLFDAERFHLASDDRFFVALYADQSGDIATARAVLQGLDPVSITDLHEGAVA